MNAASATLSRWTAVLSADLDVHRHQLKSLATLSFAMARAGSCRGLDLAAVAASPARPASVRRRFERLLANPRLDVHAVYAALADQLGRRLRGQGQSLRGRRVLLMLDESDRDDTLRSLQLLAGCGRRTLPLWATAYKPHAAPIRQLVQDAIRDVNAALRPRERALHVTLLADRGFAWPALIKLCRELGWHVVVRLQKHTRIKLPDGRVALAGELWQPGTRLQTFDNVAAFAKAGWLSGLSLTIAWNPRCKEPWLLLSDLPAGDARLRDYRKRMRCEQTFRDQKSHGLHWRDSRVNDPAHATRLLLLMSLALWLCLLCGIATLRRGLARLFTTRRRHLSLHHLGQLALRHLRDPPPLQLPPIREAKEVR